MKDQKTTQMLRRWEDSGERECTK